MRPIELRVRIIIWIGVLIVFTGYVFWGPTSVRQASRFRMANKHLPVIRAVLDSSPEYSNLQAGDYSGGGGTIRIIGHVPSADVLEKLKTQIEQTKSPVRVLYSVSVATVKVP
jgi:hypothetical protein